MDQMKGSVWMDQMDAVELWNSKFKKHQTQENMRTIFAVRLLMVAKSVETGDLKHLHLSIQLQNVIKN